MIKAYCFDMDGLLIDSEPSGAVALHRALARQGLKVDPEHYEQMIGITMKAEKELLQRIFPEQVDSEQYAEDWVDEMIKLRVQGAIMQKPGADECLRALKAANMKLALCTSNLPELVNAYLDAYNWRDLFDFVVTGTMVEHGKPAPDIFLKGAELMGVMPEECVGVEDSVNGVKAIRAAGMTSVMIPDLVPFSRELKPYVDICLSSLYELQDAAK